MVLVAGTFLSQLIPFLVSPILTRLFTPEQFGEFGLFFSIAMIITVFITGRYEMAIMLPKKDSEAFNLVVLSIRIAILISVILLILVFFLKHSVATIFNAPGIENWLYLLPVSLLAVGVYQALNYWNNRKEKYTRLALSRVMRSVNTSAWSIGLGYTLLRKGGLIIGDTIGQLMSTLFLFFRTWREDKAMLKETDKELMWTLAKRYSHFPLYNVPSGLFEKMSGNTPVMFLAYFFNDAIAGFFSFTVRIISAPSAIVARAFGDVFRQKATVQFREKGECRDLFIRTLLQLLALSIVPFTLFYFFAPQLFSFVFGSKWQIAGEYAAILTPMFFLQFVVSPMSNMFLVAEKQKIDLFLQIFLLIFVIGSFTCGYYVCAEPYMCLILFTFAYSIKYIVELLLSYQFSKGKLK